MYNTYLNNQNGPVTFSNVHNHWWSGQWQIVPVAGTRYYAIKNRWKKSYLSNDANNGFLSASGTAFNAMWEIVPVENTNAFTLKNAAGNAYLSFQAGNLVANTNAGISLNSGWIFEQ